MTLTQENDIKRLAAKGIGFHAIRLQLKIPRYKLFNGLKKLGLKTTARKTRFLNSRNKIIAQNRVKRISLVERIRNVDWTKFQKLYDSSPGGRPICAQFGVDNRMWSMATKLGLFVPRTRGESLSLTLKGRKMPECFKEKLRISMQKAVAEGRQRTPCPGGIIAPSPYQMVDGTIIFLQGSWEFKVAKWLDAQGVLWSRPTEKFQYVFEGKTKQYTPDFYIISRGFYVEVKGYQTLKDEAKWLHFPHRLVVLKADRIKILDTLTIEDI